MGETGDAVRGGRGWGSAGGRRGKERKIVEGGVRLKSSRKVGEGREAEKMLEGGWRDRGWPNLVVRWSGCRPESLF